MFLTTEKNTIRMSGLTLEREQARKMFKKVLFLERHSIFYTKKIFEEIPIQ